MPICLTFPRLSALAFYTAISISAFAQQNNLALHKPVTASTEDKQYPAANVTDGKINRQSKWQSATNRAPHIVEVNLQQYCLLSEVDVYTGIPEKELLSTEKTQAAGFFSAKNFKLQYWDDANWTDFPNAEVLENRLVQVKFKFSPAITTFKIRFVCDDGEPVNVMEIEAYGAPAPNMPAPPQLTSDIKVKAMTGDQSASVRISKETVSKSLKFVGYNQGYFFPETNVPAWIEYSNVNSVRVWAALNAFVPETYVQVDNKLKDVAAFDERKANLRRNPEHNPYLQWNNLLPLYDKRDSSSTNAMVFSFALKELKRLHIQPTLQINNTDFNDTWGNKWKQWQRYYALAYYAAKTGDVAMFAMHNEPNHANSGPMKLATWISGMQIVSDAIHCAVEDVNKKYGKHLQGKFVGPVTAGQNTDWWAAVTKAIRTDYHGKTIDHDLIDIFSTHSYNSPAAGYSTRVSNIRKVITDNHPEGQALPIVFTEIGRWMNAYLIDKWETMDSPSLFTEWAGIYANNMKNAAYGMWAFKFANTASDTYPLGIKSGHHLTWHGQRIVEDAYQNIAAGKPVKASFEMAEWRPNNITDGLKTDASAWHSDSASTEKWLEIDLGREKTIGSAVIYTGTSSGEFTGPDRVKNFKLQYLNGSNWQDIPGSAVKNCRYVQVFQQYKQPISASKIRWVSNDPGMLKVREIKLFAAGNGPSLEADFNVSGVQRTAEVVRLFAKGFKDERPLLKTENTANDTGLDTYTSFDETKQLYYVWLVQRGQFDYKLNIDLASLGLDAATPFIAETVDQNNYGEVTGVYHLINGKLPFTLKAQSVTLLTIPAVKNPRAQTVSVAADAGVMGGNLSAKNYGSAKQLSVALNAAQPEKNAVSYISFKVDAGQVAKAARIILNVNGKTSDNKGTFRLHVYGISDQLIAEQSLNWKNAPLLDKNEALIHHVGQQGFVAGELAFDATNRTHSLDVTDMLKKHVKDKITFVFVRETRELGDDVDKNRAVYISSKESLNKPTLQFITGASR